jgi:hypothetical protein
MLFLFFAERAQRCRHTAKFVLYISASLQFVLNDSKAWNFAIPHYVHKSIFFLLIPLLAIRKHLLYIISYELMG